MKKWNKKEVMAFLGVKSWNTVWRWQKERDFPLGTYLTHGGPVLFDVAAVKRWAKENETEQFVQGRSAGERPKFNLPQKEPADVAA